MSNAINVDLENFQHVMLELSQQKLVLVDFWADWCAPCKNLMPILEKLAVQYAEHLMLAKVNCDEQPQIAAQFGVRSLPTVILVKDGQPVDGFAGVQPESDIVALLQKYLPNPVDELLASAQQQLGAEQWEQAAQLAKQAHDLAPERADVKFVLASAYIQQGFTAQAKTLLETVTMVDQDATYQALMGQIELAEQAADTPEIQALQQQLAAQPDNLTLQVQLAVQLQQAKRVEEALELFFAVLKKDLNFGEAKKLALDTINGLPPGDPLASTYRRKIYSLLY